MTTATATETLNVIECQQQLARLEDELTDDSDLLQSIGFHELRILSLKARRKSPLKRFWKFRVQPAHQTIIHYAPDERTARLALRERMNKDYGTEWRVVGKPVVIDDPHEASNAAPCDLTTCLPIGEAATFVRDYREHQSRQEPDPDRPKHLPKSQLEADIERWEKRQRQLAND